MQNDYIKLSERLSDLLKDIESKHSQLLVSEILNAFGENSFGILLLIFSLLSAIPVPIPGYNTLCGIALTLLVMQMLYKKEIPWIPEKINNIAIPTSYAVKGLKQSIDILKKIEHLIYPRLNVVSSSKTFYTLLLVLATLTMVPIPFITAIPAIALLICSLGLVEGDGFVCLVGSFLGLIIIIFYVIGLYLAISLGLDAVIALFNNFYENHI